MKGGLCLRGGGRYAMSVTKVGFALLVQASSPGIEQEGAPRCAAEAYPMLLDRFLQLDELLAQKMAIKLHMTSSPQVPIHIQPRSSLCIMTRTKRLADDDPSATAAATRVRIEMPLEIGLKLVVLKSGHTKSDVISILTNVSYESIEMEATGVKPIMQGPLSCSSDFLPINPSTIKTLYIANTTLQIM